MSRIPSPWNTARMVGLLGDEEFVDALTNVEGTIEEVNETLDRVETVEDEAAQAVHEANETLTAVDQRLAKVDETISLLEAKIEAGFSLAFLLVAANLYVQGDLVLAATLALLGVLGAGALVSTARTLPQVQKLRQLGGAAYDRFNGVDEDDREFPTIFDGAEARRRSRRARTASADDEDGAATEGDSDEARGTAASTQSSG
ncbi:hypothetical protein N0B31_12035 [Salinirubellus salinus]|uniref:Uncharacterized protein n=1 Tax=Salinirubellus salinus TaxID=1364945 RepID=A0A9E7U9B3_9EURY|nr:hypothetical protein [Salinirubellus salinus]UWM52877.1 hypothetical protein N0B31_12035 [Salinirubellus salinus]